MYNVHPKIVIKYWYDSAASLCYEALDLGVTMLVFYKN